MRKAKVLVIGLDGASPEVIFRWAQAGLLSNIAGLMARGVYGPLMSTIPPVTCPAWTSSVTGVDIHKHGLYDFFLRADFKRKRLILANARKRKVKALWSLLNAEGMKTVIINLPASYPPEKVDGAMVTGMLTPSIKSQFTYPPSLKEELIDMGYIIDVGETFLDEVALYKQDPVAYICEILKMVTKRAEAALYLMKEFEWDLFLVVFVALDRINHLFWKHIDPHHIAHDETVAKGLRPWVVRVYKAIDDAIGRLVSEAGPGTNVIIYSDHGFRSLNNFVFYNDLLRKEGLLSVKKGFIRRLGPTQCEVFRLVDVLHLVPVIRLLPVWIKRTLGYRMESSDEFLSFFDIKPEETLAYQLGQFIHLNKELVCSDEERTKIVRRVLNAVMRLYPVVKIRAYSTESLFGHRVDVPEVVLLPEGFSSPSHMLTANADVVRPYDENVDIPSLMWSGDHSLYGIIVMAGSGASKFRCIKKMRIVDIAPTILKLLDLDIPAYMDGRPLIDAR